MARPKNDWLRLVSIGPHFLVCTLFGFGIGYKLDQWFDTRPVLTIIMSGFGIAAGFVNLFRELALLNEAERQDREAEPREEEEGKGNHDPKN